jgi:hypothetical protein
MMTRFSSTWKYHKYSLHYYSSSVYGFAGVSLVVNVLVLDAAFVSFCAAGNACNM